MSNNRIPVNFGPQPNRAAPPPLAIHKFKIFLKGRGLPEEQICEIQAPTVVAASLMFLAQVDPRGDVAGLCAFRVVREESAIVVPG